MKGVLFVSAVVATVSLGGCAGMTPPPPSGSYVPPPPVAVQSPPVAKQRGPYQVTCWQSTLLGGYWRNEILQYLPANPNPVCSDGSVYGVQISPYQYNPYGYLNPWYYNRPSTFYFHLGGHDEDDEHEHHD